MTFLHLVLCPWIWSNVLKFTVYGNLSRIFIILLFENCINLSYVELVYNIFQVYSILLLLCIFIVLILRLQIKILIYLKDNCQRRQWQLTPVLLPGKSHWRKSLVGCSPWGLKKLDTTEWLHFHFSLSCIGEGNGNPLQCSCLENPRQDGILAGSTTVEPGGLLSMGSHSQTRLKRLSSSSKR